jgi:HTH-type transcriptional regulator/antitoxin HigA
MATRTPFRKPPVDSYMGWIHRFPLKPIKNDADHGRAVAIIGELLGRKVDSGAGDYLDTLILLVNQYEDKHHTPHVKDMTAREALKAIMNANGLSQAKIGAIIGSESAVSMFLKGERELSKSHIKALTTRFRVDASLFF